MVDDQETGKTETTTENTNDQSQVPPSSTQQDDYDAETREHAARAGGYNAPGGAPPNPASQPSTTVPDMAAVDEADTNDDGDRITTQAGREAAGPFTGTGDQDAMRTSGTLGSTDAHHADERTSSDQSAVADEEGESETPSSAEDEDGA